VTVHGDGMVCDWATVTRSTFGIKPYTVFGEYSVGRSALLK